MSQPAPSSTPTCPVCGSPTEASLDVVVLGRHHRSLRRCPVCAHVFHPAPDWLDEAYEEAIASTDVGLVDRSQRMTNIVTTLLGWIPGDEPCLDFAAGTGLLVRMLRDRGVDARYHDVYGSNHHAPGFEVDAQPPERYRLVTAVEVLEHLIDPVAELERLLGLTDHLLATTKLVDAGGPDPSWDYLCNDTGQHITFFSASSLAGVAERLGVTVQSRGDLHLFSRSPLPGWKWRVATTSLVGHVLAPTRRRLSLVATDHELARRRAAVGAGDGR